MTDVAAVIAYHGNLFHFCFRDFQEERHSDMDVASEMQKAHPLKVYNIIK